MNLRTRAIALSLLPLVLILLLGLPEAILQRRVSLDTAQEHKISFGAAHGDFSDSLKPAIQVP